MGGKARVHELAKEFGVTSKEVLAQLAANGEWVKSASSTVEAGVARRLREAYGFPDPGPRAAAAKDRRRAAATIPTPLDVAEGKAQRQRTVGAPSAQPKIAGGKGQSSRLTSADTLEIYRSHRLASVSENPSHAIDELFRECEARYGISRSALRQLVSSDKLRRLADGEPRVVPAKGGAERSPRVAKPGVAMQARKPKPYPAGAERRAVGTTPTQPKPGNDKGKRRYDPVTPSVAIDICERYQRACQSENPSQARDALAREWEAKYGLTQKELRRIIASRKPPVSAKELTPQNRRNAKSSVRNQRKSETARRASGKQQLTTQYCVGCKTRTSMKGFSIAKGLCTECLRGRSQVRPKAAASNGRRKAPQALGPKSWKCPNCLKRIDVDSARVELVRHLNTRGDRCAGSGYRLPQRSTDAMDYRVAGSFESGRG